MLSASVETFDSHSTHAALPLECQQTSQSSQAGVGLVRLLIPLQCFQKQCMYHSTLRGVGSLLDISIICERSDLTKVIRCHWHLASASGDRQVKEASQPIGPWGVWGGGVWASSQDVLGLLVWTPHLHTNTHHSIQVPRWHSYRIIVLLFNHKYHHK